MSNPPTNMYEEARRDLSRLRAEAGKAIHTNRKDPAGRDSQELRDYAMKLDDWAAGIAKAQRTQNLLPPCPRAPDCLRDFVRPRAATKSETRIAGIEASAGVDVSDLDFGASK